MVRSRVIISFNSCRRRRSGNVKGAQRHVVELTMILRVVLCHEDFLFRQRNPESPGYLTGRSHGGEEVDALHVEMDAARLERIRPTQRSRRKPRPPESGAHASPLENGIHGDPGWERLAPPSIPLPLAARPSFFGVHSAIESRSRCCANSFSGSRLAALRNSACASTSFPFVRSSFPRCR